MLPKIVWIALNSMGYLSFICVICVSFSYISYVSCFKLHLMQSDAEWQKPKNQKHTGVTFTLLVSPTSNWSSMFMQ